MPKVVCALAELKKSQAAWGCPDLMYVRDGARSLTHPLGGVGWGGGGVRPKAVISSSAKIFTTLPEWGYDEIVETDFACQSFQSLFFS